jgi:hypothetical protein
MTSEAAANNLVLWLAQIFVVASVGRSASVFNKLHPGRNDAGSIIR